MRPQRVLDGPLCEHICEVEDSTCWTPAVSRAYCAQDLAAVPGAHLKVFMRQVSLSVRLMSRVAGQSWQESEP